MAGKRWTVKQSIGKGVFLMKLQRDQMKPRYVNLFTDFGFKKLFGEEASKPQLMDFLNALLPEHARIKELFPEGIMNNWGWGSWTGRRFLIYLKQRSGSFWESDLKCPL